MPSLLDLITTVTGYLSSHVPPDFLARVIANVSRVLGVSAP